LFSHLLNGRKRVRNGIMLEPFHFADRQQSLALGLRLQASAQQNGN
jgi:hypothetical protein